ncbi:MAG TPA: VWA domain-containing protein [Myxococcaceae bacterium]|nr:VWA domain-containing protein [Myxococcaceae bacterium]
MDARIVEFAEVLRQNGVRVSTAEVVDAAQAVAIVGVQDRDLFRSVLRSTLVKRDLDLEAFDRAFDFFFSGAAKTFEALDEALLKQLEEQGLLEGDELQMVVATVNRLFNQLSPMAQAALQNDRARLAQLFRAATLQLDLSRMETPMQAGFFSRRLLAGAGAERARTDLQSLEQELQARGLSLEGLEVVSKQLASALRKVEDAARREVDRQMRARLKRSSGGLQDRPFHALSRAEVERAEAAVRKLAERLKTRLVRKQRSTRRGALNVRRTLRRNMPWGGVPMVPLFRSRRPERPEVVVLCDVSDSVRNASRMMLLFTYTLQSLFVRVRSFVFVSDMGEVTKYFKDADPEEAIDLATAGKAVSLHSNSNYGRALANFTRDELGSLGRRTTLMVIGDGRNNYNPSNVWALKDLKRKVKRLIWITPEDRRSWGFGDSEMHSYSKAVHQTVVVQTLADLERLADQLVPS